MLHISQFVSSAWTHTWCFHCSSLSLSKGIAEKLLVTFHDLKWPRWHGEGSLVLTRAPTGGGYPSPRRFFVDNGKTVARSAAKYDMTIPFIFFYTLCANCNFLSRSGRQVSLNDPTSHHLFATLRPRHSRVDDRALWKLLDAMSPYEPTTRTSLIFYINNLRSGQFLDLPIISQCRGGGQLAHFWQILVVLATSIMGDISHDHPRLSSRKFVYVTAVRSCDVIKDHQNVFANSFA